MNIERIKNYNQKLLAVFGTLLGLVAVIGLVFFLYVAISEFFWDTYEYEDEGILSHEKVEELLEENKRQQLVTYNDPQLLDTVNMVYLVAVSHRFLDTPEYIDGGVLGLLNTFEPKSSSKLDYRYSQQYYGYFNNMLLYDYKKNQLVKIIEKRVNFDEFQVEYFENDIIVWFKASTKDTYKDGVINQNDLRSLFLYSLKERKLKEINIDNADVKRVSFVENQKDIFITFGLDKNENGRFDRKEEPTQIKLYNFETGEISNLVSNQIHQELQKSLEGTKDP